MHLFEKNGNSIDVYTMTPNAEKIARFKEAEMERIPFKERVYKATCDWRSKYFENAEFEANYFDIVENYSESGMQGEQLFHKISTYPINGGELVRQNMLLDDYYKGEFKDKPIVSISRIEIARYKVLKYLLLTQSSYNKFGNHDCYIMDNIISIPRTLYLLQLLEQEKIELLLKEIDNNNDDISKQLALFDIEKVNGTSFSMDIIEQLYAYKLVAGARCYTNMLIDNSSKILAKSRQQPKL